MCYQGCPHLCCLCWMKTLQENPHLLPRAGGWVINDGIEKPGCSPWLQVDPRPKQLTSLLQSHSHIPVQTQSCCHHASFFSGVQAECWLLHGFRFPVIASGLKILDCTTGAWAVGALMQSQAFASRFESKSDICSDLRFAASCQTLLLDLACGQLEQADTRACTRNSFKNFWCSSSPRSSAACASATSSSRSFAKR